MAAPGGYSNWSKLHDAVAAIGNGETVYCSPVPEGAHLRVGVQIKGITTATVTFEVTIDGTNWVAILAKNVTSGAEATTATADGIYTVDIYTMVQFRARISAWTAGTITVTANIAA